MRSFGLVEKLFKNYNEPKCRLETPEAEKQQILSLFKLQGAFWAWLVGIVASIIILILEITVNKLMNSNYIDNI